MKPTPFPHQVTGGRFIAERKVCALWWSMRTGKSFATLEGINTELGIDEILIVCPSSVKSVWGAYLEKYGIEHEVYKPGRKRKPAKSLVINFESVWRKKAAVDVTKYRALVIDESIRLQDWTTYGVQWWFANMQRLPDVRVLLSGAPCPESVLQVAPQLWVLRKGSPKYRNVFTNYLYSNWYYDEHSFKWKPDGSDVEPALRRLMDSVGSVLTQEDVGVAVRKQYLQIDVEPTRRQKKIVKQILETDKFQTREGRSVNADDFPARRAQLLALASSGVNGLNPLEHVFEDSSKINACVDYVGDILKDYPEERFVVFTNFQNTPRVVGSLLSRYGHVVYCTGQDGEEERAEAVRVFQRGDAVAIVVNVVVGKMGIDLSRANFLLYLENNWSGDARIQSEERATRLDKTGVVQVVDFCTSFGGKANVDAAISKAVKSKSDFNAKLLDGLK